MVFQIASYNNDSNNGNQLCQQQLITASPPRPTSLSYGQQLYQEEDSSSKQVGTTAANSSNLNNFIRQLHYAGLQQHDHHHQSSHHQFYIPHYGNNSSSSVKESSKFTIKFECLDVDDFTEQYESSAQFNATATSTTITAGGSSSSFLTPNNFSAYRNQTTAAATSPTSSCSSTNSSNSSSTGTTPLSSPINQAAAAAAAAVVASSLSLPFSSNLTLGNGGSSSCSISTVVLPPQAPIPLSSVTIGSATSNFNSHPSKENEFTSFAAAPASSPSSNLEAQALMSFHPKFLKLNGADSTASCSSSISSSDEMKPPSLKKSRKQFIPNELKDEKYWSRRRKNNVAAKRSRDARRMKENQIAIRASYLERENDQLKKQLDDFRRETKSLKLKLSHYEAQQQHL